MTIETHESIQIYIHLETEYTLTSERGPFSSYRHARLKTAKTTLPENKL